MIVIEMNPRVSRSSALASKATGFPIAKIAAKLAVGYTLDELRTTSPARRPPASSRPSTTSSPRCPRFTFEKFPQADPTLTTQMKSVGEAMAIGRTFKESLQKALRSLEVGRVGFRRRQDTATRGQSPPTPTSRSSQKLASRRTPSASSTSATPSRAGFTVEEIFELTKIDPWFLAQLKELVDEEERSSRESRSVR